MLAFRMVLNRLHNETIVSGITSSFDAKLNGEAGEILLALQNNIVSLEDLELEYPNFFEQCRNYNWIEGDNIKYKITEVDTHYHLKRIQIELTLFWNLNCSYCYSSSGLSQKSKLSYNKVIEIIDEAYDLGCIWVDFTRGEPLAYKGWEEVLSYAIKKGLVCSLHTNGTLLNKNNVSKLKNLGIRYIQISLDSHLEEIHDKARQREGAFKKTLEGIKNCQEKNISTRVSIVAHRSNFNHYVEAVRYFKNVLGVKVLMDRVIKAGSEISSNMGLTTPEYFNLIRPLIREGVADSKVCDNFAVKDIEVEPHCGVAHSFLYITVEGEYALCPTMTSRDDPLLFMSPRINHYSLKEAWLTSPYVLKYRGLNCGNTDKCPTASKCGGGCRSNAYIESKELDSPDLLSCNIFKNFTEDYIEFEKLYKSNSSLN